MDAAVVAEGQEANGIAWQAQRDLPGFSFPAGFADTLTDDERVQTLWWKESFEYGERFLSGSEETNAYLAEVVARHRDRPAARPALSRRLLRRLRLG